VEVQTQSGRTLGLVVTPGLTQLDDGPSFKTRLEQIEGEAEMGRADVRPVIRLRGFGPSSPAQARDHYLARPGRSFRHPAVSFRHLSASSAAPSNGG
jgi:hypothetical protein